MTRFQGIWQTMVLEVGATQTQDNNIGLTLSEQRKQNFYKHLKDTNSYDQWRANIHQQLEDDLQRQVQEVLDETERQERLAKLRREHLRSLFLSKPRASQRLSSQSRGNNTRQGDQCDEIDRRNQRVLYPLNAKDSYGAQNHHSSFTYQKNKLFSGSFNLETYNSYCRRRRARPSQQTNEHSLDNSSTPFQKLHDKQTTLTSNNTSLPFLYETNIRATNKAEILALLEQQSNTGDNSNVYTNEYGVIISGDGPFWPQDFRILHPTPRLPTSELASKEFYLTVTNSLFSSK